MPAERYNPPATPVAEEPTAIESVPGLPAAPDADPVAMTMEPDDEPVEVPDENIMDPDTPETAHTLRGARKTDHHTQH